MKSAARLLLLSVPLIMAPPLAAHAASDLAVGSLAWSGAVWGQTTPATEAERKQSAEQWLKMARQSLREGNPDQAEKHVDRAEKLGVKFDSFLSRYGGDTPENLRRDIALARSARGGSSGAEASRPAAPPISSEPPAQGSNASRPSRLPPTQPGRPAVGAGAVNAQPQAAPLSAQQQAGKAAAQRLAAQAQAALDRGDLQAAKQFADQAEALRIPDALFGEGELRPWEVSLRVQSAVTRRSGVQLATSVAPATPTADSVPAGRFPVAQGVYDPSMDPSRNVLVQSATPTPATPGGNSPNANSTGLRLYQQGLQALAAQDRGAALQAFREAWRFERELSPEIRQELKDKLSLLTQPEPVAPGGTATEPSPLEEVASAQQLQYQKLSREIYVEEQNARKLTSTDPRGALEKMQSLRARVEQTELDAAAKKQLLTLVDRNINGLQAYIEQNRSEIDLNARNTRILNEIEQERTRKYETDDKIAQLVEEYNDLVDQERFAEAEVKAKQVRELAPESPIARALLTRFKFQSRLKEQEDIRAMKEEGFYQAMTSVEQSAAPFDDRNVIEFGDIKRFQEIAKTRGERANDSARRMSPQDMKIHQALSKQVDVRFTDRPLSEVIETLSSVAGINIHPDPAGLAAEGVTPSTPVTLNFAQPISLKSVLTLILEPLHLGYVVRNEVLMITSEQTRDSNVYTKVYYVADLVTPIPNFVPGYDMGLPAAIREAHRMLGYGNAGLQPVSTAPLAFAQNAPTNDLVGSNAGILAQYAANAPSPGGTRANQPMGLTPGHMGGAALADFDTLIQLIQTTVAPDTWLDNGGEGAIDSFPTNLSLVISQTQEVHDQITDLLEQLRRLQDLQVAIEVRFISLTDNFFERIGVDFDIKLDDNSVALRRDDQGNSQAIGLGQTGQPTPDFDIPFLTGSGPGNGSFSLTTPNFGGFGQGAGALNFGVAILSDIETFFLLQAATGDSRSNIMSAPKVTLFNGQSANVSDSSQRPFVTSLIPVVGDFAAAHQPVITVLNEGTQLGVQAVVSSDRRFVRLTLVPVFSQIGDVEEFTFTGATTTDTGTNVVDANGEPTGDRDNATTSRVGTTVQLPTFSFTTVSTTVSVPDGGTVLLGGIKRLSEERNEQGVPMLSQLPYVNRLFKNVGIGRESESLMLMVTPRIIIQEEEEARLGIGLTP